MEIWTAVLKEIVVEARNVRPLWTMVRWRNSRSAPRRSENRPHCRRRGRIEAHSLDFSRKDEIPDDPWIGEDLRRIRLSVVSVRSRTFER